MSRSYDLIVLGAGPGGYVAAIRAAQLGMKVAVIEEKHLGGICLNWGCIPTKALLRSAEVLHLAREGAAFGLRISEPAFDFGAIVDRSRKVAARLSSGVAHLMKKNRIAVISGRGRLAGRGRVRVEGKDAGEYTAPHIIIATGARPRALPGLEPDGRLVWTYFEALRPERLPRSLLIIGSGAIGMEFAHFYHTLGTEVTVVEIAPRILPAEDAEISDFVRKVMERRGLRFRLGARVAALKRGNETVTATVEDEDGRREEITVERVLAAVGVMANVEDIGLEETGVKVENGVIAVDEWQRTNVPGIYAIGDVAGPPMLAHKASHEGIICVERIAGLKDIHPLVRTRVPACTYCHPQVASVGLTEEAARNSGRKVRVGRFPLLANGKAIALGEDQGLVKTIFDAETGELLGAHMAGPEVTEMIQGFVIAMGLETTEAELMHTVFPHPTVSESMHEAVLAAYTGALHI
jgi:dihydrolipoamide dehydrogenase